MSLTVSQIDRSAMPTSMPTAYNSLPNNIYTSIKLPFSPIDRCSTSGITYESSF